MDKENTKKTKKTTNKKESNSNWSEMEVNELKLELQKLILKVRSGTEKNTSLIKKLKKEIAKKLSNENNK